MEKAIGQNKKQTFMNSVLLIATAQIVVKILGFVYRLVITNIPAFGDAGNGYYSAGFQIYMILIAISSMGIPSAISKLVSERKALGDNAGAHKIFKTALVLFAIIGGVGASILFFGAGFIANVIIDNPGAEYTIMGLAPSVFFVCLSAVIRGYFNGMQNMKATSGSQIFEQICNCVLTIVIVYALSGTSAVMMAAGSSVATTVATILSFIFLIIFYNVNKRKVWKEIRENQTADESVREKRNAKQIAKSILAISIPISLGSIISAINRTVDSVTVIRGLKASMGYTTELANYWYGILSGKIDSLTSFPLALNIAFSVALIPAIASAMALKDSESASKRISFSMQLTMLIALPCTIGMIVLANPILHLLYPNAYEGALLLQISAVTIIFTAMSQTMNGSLQGLGKVIVPAISLGSGCVVKIICNMLLIYNPMFNVYGAAIGSVMCHIIASSISFIVLRKTIKLKLNFKRFIFKPVLINVLMGIIAWGSYSVLNGVIGMTKATIIAIGLAIVSYLAMLVGFKVLEKEDYYMIPGGLKVVQILEKFKIY